MSDIQTAKTDGESIFDGDRAEAFAGRMMQGLNDGAMCLMASLGHRTGLFDVMSRMPAAGSAAIAKRAELDERYVREWLKAMTTAGIVEHDPETMTFELPAEHAAFLTREAGADNVAMYGQWISMLGSVEDDVVECFERGGGVPYSRYDRFHEIMAEESSQTLLPILREQVLALVPGLVERLEEGIRVADLGCGQGQALNLMAGWFPNSEFIGYDLSEEAIESARKQAAGLELSNVAFLVRDLSTFDEDAERSAYDFVTTFDAIHDQARPAALLRGIARSLTDDGVYLAQDINGSRHLHNNIDHPLATVLYTVSCMHCMTVSLAQGGEGLGTMWGHETAVEMLEEAGFGDVEVHEFEEDIQNCFFVCSLG
ncbi:MAG: class I SAM-dependent methyltransferase [Persicimonas sp.]